MRPLPSGAVVDDAGEDVEVVVFGRAGRGRFGRPRGRVSETAGTFMEKPVENISGRSEEGVGLGAGGLDTSRGPLRWLVGLSSQSGVDLEGQDVHRF